MPIDPSIALQTRGIELPDPINQFAKIQQIKAAQNQNALADLTYMQHQREFDQGNALNDQYKNALGANGQIDRSKLYSGVATAGLGSRIPGLQKSFADADKAQGEVDKQKVELLDAKLKQSRAFLDTVTTPEQYIAWHEANHKDPVLGAALAARGVTADQARASIMDAIKRPGGFEDLLNKSRLGIEKFTELNKPNITTRNLGGTSEIVATPGLGGAPVVLNTATVTQSPDSVASNETQRANNAANIGIQRERLNYEKSQPKGQIIQTDQGVMLVDPRGGAAQPVTSNGEPLQPKLRQLPAAVQKSISENNASLRKVETAIAELEKYPDAFGVKNYLGDTIRQRTDPQGVGPRAFVADIGSLIVHDRSGASVTAAETPRLKPFIPDVRDNPATIKVKLKRFRDEYKAIQDDYVSMYSREQGYKVPNAPTAGSKPTLGQIFGE